MATFSNTNDLKKFALRRAGELSDGTSEYDSDAIEYINDAYQGLFAGGSEFHDDIDELWIWAKASRPIVLTLEPVYDSGTVSLTEGSKDGTFSLAPSDSQEGRYLKLDNREDYFVIAKHTAGEAAFELDQPYTEATNATLSFDSIKLDYELSDDVIVINEYNNRLDFGDGASGEYNATLDSGSYTPSELSTEIAAKMVLAGGGQTYTVSFSQQTRKFSIASDGPTLYLDFATGANNAISVAETIGYTIGNKSGDTSYEAESPLNAIYRLFGPMQVFKDIDPNMYFFEGINLTYGRFSYDTSTAQGNIYAIDFASFLMDYPLTHLTQGTPDRFAEVKYANNGIAKVRFNRYVSEKTRVVVEYIPQPVELVDNSSSIPKIPKAFRAFLAHAAAYYLMLDKSDNRAQTQFQLAQAKLMGLVKYNRTSLKLSGRNYGRLIPRRY